MNINDKIELISNIELFKGLSAEELLVIAKEAQVISYNPGQLLFMENNPRKEIFLVAE